MDWTYFASIERLSASVRGRAQRQLWRRLTDGLTDQHRQLLDQLLEIRAGGGQSTLAWLRQTAYTATPCNFPKLVERLTLVRSLGVDPERATRVHQNYWLKLAREGGQSTVQHLAELEPLRRYATLTALVLELTATLIDEALNMFEHLVGQIFKKSERAHAEQFHASGKSINEKVRLYARVGQALIEARSTGGDVFAAIESVLPWSKFESTVAEAQKLAQPEEFDYLALLDERYSTVRKFAPLLLAHFEFHAAPVASELLQALDLLRDLNASGKRTLPEDVPAGFVKRRWRSYVFSSSGVDRHFYEMCTLAELRDRLRSGDIWVTGSRQYRDFETYLIPAAAFKEMQKNPLPLDIDTDLPSYMAEFRQRLGDNLTAVSSKAREGTLADVTLENGELRIAKLRKNTPESAEAFAEKAYALLPHVKITELFAEVDQWTNLGDRFVHLHTQAPPKNRQALLTAILADAINLGLARMAEACRDTTWRQLCWTSDWHIREESYALALAGLIDAQNRQPLNGLALALRELGKLERTLFTLQWLQDPELRRRSYVGLNKGEQQNALRRAVFFNRLGEIRDRSYENQRHRASGLNLLVAAIILWNTVYLQRAIDYLRGQGYEPTPSDLAHLSPLGWEHINLTGDYHWETSPTLGPDQFRPLRTQAFDLAIAACGW